jgi:predicted nucleic acid-binding protein
LQRLIADTGYLVAFGRQDDPRHAGARRFADRFLGQLVTASPIIVEACHFLSSKARLELLSWAGSRTLAVAEIPVRVYPELADTIRRYSNRNLDFADASLLWLADQTGLKRILTVDVADFSTLRLRNGKRFDLVDWS